MRAYPSLLGDNSLDYVIEGAKVSAVDFNSCQIALVELKVKWCYSWYGLRSSAVDASSLCFPEIPSSFPREVVSPLRFEWQRD